MEELEKILEEIEQRIEKAKKIIVEHPSDKMDEIANDTAEAFIEAYKECQDIIRKHMNDGWISVEERLPEDGQTVLCTDGENIYLVEYDADLDAGFGDMDCITAWRPLPEPYRPEQPETCKYTGGSCCWPIDQCKECPNYPERSEEE